MTQELLTAITDSAALKALCDRLSGDAYVTVDTEFMRERTYFPQLCLVQIAGANHAALIDALAEGLDWTPFWELMKNPKILKVFHSPRQDIEIFVKMSGFVPTPLFDTQIAAMACGFPDQSSYARLAESLAGTIINKEEQFTDWTRRPLRAAQLEYALSDVTVLRPVYEALRNRLAQNGRIAWLAGETDKLNAIDTYRVNPDDAWQKLRLRTNKPASWAALRKLAAWREMEAMRVNRPRQMVLKDDVLSQLALSLPDTLEKLEGTRGFPKGLANGARGDALVALIREAKGAGKDAVPPRDDTPALSPAQEDQLELLKLALKIVARQAGTAPRLIGNNDDLEAFVAGRDTPLRHGWRADIFGSLAEKLLTGKTALGVNGLVEIAA
jgi:ribonuclease D